MFALHDSLTVNSCCSHKMSNRRSIQACDWPSMVGVHPLRGVALRSKKGHIKTFKSHTWLL